MESNVEAYIPVLVGDRFRTLKGTTVESVRRIKNVGGGTEDRVYVIIAEALSLGEVPIEAVFAREDCNRIVEFLNSQIKEETTCPSQE